jgi:endonuclease/exonuclease/phosphatase (EEP) superfamily protein YafD
MGDFNLPPESVIYRRDWGGFTNAFEQWGQGYGYTMETKRGAVRIDHILFSDTWHCRGVVIGPELGSAHKPVIASFHP